MHQLHGCVLNPSSNKPIIIKGYGPSGTLKEYQCNRDNKQYISGSDISITSQSLKEKSPYKSISAF